MSTWILVANAATATLYARENLRAGKLQWLEEFSHPDSRKKVTELVADKPGRYINDLGASDAYNKNNPKKVAAEHFALQLAQKLQVSLAQGQYQYLLIIAPAQFYSLIKKHLHTPHTEVIYIAKDYTKYEPAKLEVALREHLFK